VIQFVEARNENINLFETREKVSMRNSSLPKRLAIQREKSQQQSANVNFFLFLQTTFLLQKVIYLYTHCSICLRRFVLKIFEQTFTSLKVIHKTHFWLRNLCYQSPFENIFSEETKSSIRTAFLNVLTIIAFIKTEWL